MGFDFEANLLGMLFCLITGVLSLVLAYKIITRDSKKSYYERSFFLTFVSSGIASLLGSLFRIPYLLQTIVSGELWIYGSFSYYFFMSISLTFLLATALAIIKERKGFYLGLTTFICLVPICIGYFIQFIIPTARFVTLRNNLADTNMTLEGTLLVFGVLALQIILTCIAFFLVFHVTKLKNILVMFYGMIIIAVSPLCGAFADLIIIEGNYERLIDPIGYILVAIGLLVMYSGFRIKQPTDAAK